MQLNFTGSSITLDAAAAEDGPRISGIAAPYNVDAAVSTGQTVRILAGALPTDGPMPRLVVEHDTSRVVGVVDQRVNTPEGMLFSARIADTTEGRDLIALLKMGALDKVSVGVNALDYEMDGRTMVIKAAAFDHLAVVYEPAFKQAQITEIAASQDESEPETTPPTSEGDEEVEITPEAAPVEAATIPTQPLYAAAAKPFTMPSAGEYVSKFLAGGAEFAEFNARIRAAAPNVETTDVGGILPEPIVSGVFNSLRGLRPVIDAIGARAMPQGGKIFRRPSVTTHTTIGASNGENTALDQGTFVVTDNQVTKEWFGGYVRLSEEAMDETSPEVLGLLIDDMARVYAKQTDNYAADNLVTGATQTLNFDDADYDKPEKWAEWAYWAAATILTNSGGNLPTHIFVDPNMWQRLGRLSDDSGRPLFPQIGPMNAFGNLTPGVDSGIAFGMRVVVDANFPVNTFIIGNPAGFEIFEQPKGAISVEAADGSLSRYVKFRGVIATLMIDATMFTKAAIV